MPGVPPPPVRIRDLTDADEAVWLAAVERSRALHAPWQQLADSHERWEQMLDRLALPSYACLLLESVADLDADDGGLVGFVNVSDIVRGAFMSAYLGYAAFVPYAGRGLFSAGLRLVVDHCFATLALHRVEANVQPGNERSRTVVRRLGFRLEGLSPRYLWVDGGWRDHERWAVTVEEWPGGGPDG